MVELKYTLKRLWEILEDGKPHKISELMSALSDQRSKEITLRQQLTSLRKKIKPYGWRVVQTNISVGRPAKDKEPEYVLKRVVVR